MPRTFSLDNFPFPDLERVQLLWLQSPKRLERTEQVELKASFKAVGGFPKEMDMPWGALPMLRVGQVYQDGRPLDSDVGQVFTVTVGDVEVEMRRAREVVSAEHYRLYKQSNYDENCFVFPTVEEEFLVVSPLELTRACFAHNRILAESLLGSNSVQIFVNRHSTDGAELKLQFHQSLRRHDLTETFVRQIARLLYLPSFSNAWESVARNFETRGYPWTMELIPHLQPEWRVRGVKRGRTLLALEILSITLADSLPFEWISYSISGKSFRRTITSRENPMIIRLPVKGQLVIDTTGESTSKKKLPRSLPSLPPALGDPRRPRLRMEMTDEEPEEVAKRLPDSIGGREDVGLTPKTREGKIRSSDFNSEFSTKISQPEGSLPSPSHVEDLILQTRHADFAAKLGELEKFVKPIEVFHVTLIVLADKYVNVVVAVVNDSLYLPTFLIEIETTGTRKAATLLVVLTDRQDNSEDEKRLSQLITQTVSSQANWQLHKLEAVKRELPWIVDIHRLLHVGTAEKGAERILQKLWPAPAQKESKINEEN